MTETVRTFLKSKPMYEARPFFYAGLAVYALTQGQQVGLVSFFAGPLLVCSALILYWRYTYRRSTVHVRR